MKEYYHPTKNADVFLDNPNIFLLSRTQKILSKKSLQKSLLLRLIA